MKTLYLHIGTPKTGTSAIQDFLANNAELLDEKGYCYKQMPYRYVRGASDKRNGHFLVGKIYDDQYKIDKVARRERIKEGMTILEQWFDDYDKVILTDEAIWNSMARKEHEGIIAYVKSFCDERDIALKVIVYIRSQDDYVESWWRQKIRSGSKMREWEYFIKHLPKKKLITDYYAQISKIAADIGKENLMVRRYEKGSFLGNNQTIFSDFLDAIGLEYTDEYVVTREYVNTSLHNNYGEIKRILNELLPDDNRPFGKLNGYLADVGLYCSELKSVKKYETAMFSKEEQEEFMARYEEGNRKIAKEYFGEDGELFRPKKIDLPKWKQDNPRQYEDLVLYMGEAYFENKQEIEALKKEIEHLNKEIATMNKNLDNYKVKIDSYKSVMDNSLKELSGVRKAVSTMKKIKNKIKK